MSRGTWLSVWQCSWLTHSAWDDVTSTIAGQQTAAARATHAPGLSKHFRPIVTACLKRSRSAEIYTLCFETLSGQDVRR